MDITERLVDKTTASTHIRQAFSLYAVDRRVPERNFNLMPLEFRKMICSCSNRRGYITTSQYPGIISTCSGCKKPESYYLYRCTACENLFIHDFRAPFCFRATKCWGCINEDPTPCEGHTYCQPYWSRDQWVSPVLPKPRVFTEEELASVFDF